MFDNGFEELYMEAQVEHGIKFIRGRLSECSENIDGSLVLKVQDTLTGLPMNVSVDWLVLMVGKEAAKLPNLDKSIDLKLAPNRFVAPENIFYNPNQTSQPGIFVVEPSQDQKLSMRVQQTRKQQQCRLSII